MYLNYDGQGHQFGDTSVEATSADQDKLAIYAAQRSSDGALTVMIINKTSTALSSTVTLSHFTSGLTAAVYRYSAANLNAIVLQPNQAIGNGSFTATFPAAAITLFVIPSGGPTFKVYLPVLLRN
jgi:hypothetical protein